MDSFRENQGRDWVFSLKARRKHTHKWEATNNKALNRVWDNSILWGTGTVLLTYRLCKHWHSPLGNGASRGYYLPFSRYGGQSLSLGSVGSYKELFTQTLLHHCIRLFDLTVPDSPPPLAPFSSWLRSTLFPEKSAQGQSPHLILPSFLKTFDVLVSFYNWECQLLASSLVLTFLPSS